MDKQYRYRAVTNLISTGYPGEEIGPPSGTTPWVTTSVLSGSNTTTYYFRDSNANPPSNANSSKVSINLKDTWQVSIDSHNVMTVKVDTDVINIVRGDILGNPNLTYHVLRNMYLRRTINGANLASWVGLDIGTVGQISGPINLPSYTFTLQPGESASRNTLYVLNYNPDHLSDPLPSLYVDVIGVGVEFQNILPKDYRPGMSWNGTAYMSHDRAGGICNVWDGSNWTEMRTENAPTGKGNPPLIYRDGDWYNQALIGNE